MTQLKHFSAGLMALGISLALQGGAAAATDTAPAFRILSDEEIAAHSAIMNSLQGEARDEYRNAQYEQLKQRALDNGFRLPATPPWAAHAAAGSGQVTATTAAEPVPGAPTTDEAEKKPAAPAEDTAAEAMARHAAMRDKLQAQQPAPPLQTDPGLENLKAMVSAQQRQVDAERMAAQQAAAAQPPATSAPAEPRFAPVEEITAAQALATAPEAPPAAPMAPAAPPTPATPPTPPAQVAGPPGAYPVGPEAPAVRPPAPAPAPAPAPTTASTDGEAGAAGDVAVAVPDAGPAYGGPDAMGTYRESMRTRFDEYMKERQAQYEEAMRRQREQHEAEMEQRRSQAGLNRPQPPYPYPAMPSYGPRYPAAFPGYRTPYWQQPQQ